MFAVIASAGSVRVSRGAAGSVVAAAFATSPLRLLTPRNNGTAAWIYTSTFGGGLLDGDDVRLRVEIEEGQSAYLASQASTKVYRAVERHAAVHLEAAIARGGLLVVAPDPVVCFARARYEQTQRFAVDATGGLVLVDWFTSGRHARGERWAFDRYSSRGSVHRGGRLVWHDAVLLDRADGPIAPRMGRYDVLATIVLAGSRLDDCADRTLAMVAAAPAPRSGSLVVSGSPIAGGGAVVRLAGRSVEQVGQTIRQCLAFVPELLGDDPWARRW
jgi:urease accessory protein